MVKTMTKISAVALVGLLWVAGGVAHQDKKSDKKADVAGRWTMAVKGSPHGDVSMALVLQQSGRKVTGTLTTPHGDALKVDGELADANLTLETAREGEHQLSLKAKLKDDGTLDGYLSSQMGDMTWTARRTGTEH